MMSAFPLFPSAATGKADYVGRGGLGPLMTLSGHLSSFREVLNFVPLGGGNIVVLPNEPKSHGHEGGGA